MGEQQGSLSRSKQTLRFLVVGATGAVGKAVVRYLTSVDVSNQYDINVITVGRHEVPEEYVSNPNKVRQIVIPTLDSMENNTELHQSIGSFIDGACCCLGTTRGTAKSAEQFKKVDVEYVASTAKLAKHHNAKAFGLISAQGASKNLLATDWKILHGLLYSKCKGLAEEHVKNEQFPYTVILRPGLIDRKEDARSSERFAAKLLPTVSTDTLARVMVDNMLRSFDTNKANTSGVVVDVLEMKEIKSSGV
jgi:oxidoreductase